MDIVNPEENKLDYKKTYLCMKKFSEILTSNICTKREKLTELKN